MTGPELPPGEPPQRETQQTPEELLERAILGEDVVFNAQEVSQETGVTLDQIRRLWRALGFPEHGGETAFTRADADAVSTMSDVVASGLIDFDLAVNLTRAVGQTVARLADWEVTALVQRVEELTLPESGGRLGSAMRIVEEFNAPFEQLIIYAWRRHLAAAIARVEAVGAGEEDLHTSQLTVGFADIVSFTALSNQLTEAKIGDLVELFESRCADVVAAQRGRVIKSLGDAVLFVNDDPIRAYDTAEGIINVVGRDSRMPDVRLGLATRIGGDAARRRVRPAGQHGGPADRGGPAQPDHRRRHHRGAAAGRPVRGPAAARTAGPGLRHRRAGGGAPALSCRTAGAGPARPGKFRGFAARSAAASYRVRVFEVQDVRLDPESRRTWRGVEEIVLSRKEFDLVHALIARAGRIVTRDELMREVWGTTFWTSSKTIDVHLGWVRRKLGDDSRRPRLISTVRGQGLRFETGDETGGPGR